MEDINDCFIQTYCGPIRGDECSDNIYEATEPVTVQELCNYILSNDREWGYIGIACPGTIFGNPNVQYYHGKYVDDNRNQIDFAFPPYIANAIVKRINWNGGWSSANWILTI